MLPPGSGTVLNVATILIGSGLGVLVGHRLPERTRSTVTDALGLMTLVLGGLNVADGLGSADYVAAVGSSATVLIVLGALLIGGIVGSLARIEDRLARGGAVLKRRLTRTGGAAGHDRFVEGYVTASLVFLIGPLAILGSLSDGLGRGIDQLALKSTLDGFASIAFAASFGWGVAAAALSVAALQGLLTVAGVLVGDLLPVSYVDATTATGGVLLLGVGLRLLAVKQVPVGDLLPALVVAPVLVALIVPLR